MVLVACLLLNSKLAQAVQTKGKTDIVTNLEERVGVCLDREEHDEEAEEGGDAEGTHFVYTGIGSFWM